MNQARDMTGVPVGVLLRAKIAAELSSRIYDVDNVRADLKSGSVVAVESEFTPLGLRNFTAVPFYCAPRQASVQYAMWEVAQVGVIVAFRGTCNLLDFATDCDIEGAKVPGSAWSVHRGIARAVEKEQVYQEVMKQYYKWCTRKRGTPLPLTLTGLSAWQYGILSDHSLTSSSAAQVTLWGAAMLLVLHLVTLLR